MNRIATINFKGGVGKTTVTWALGEVTSKQKVPTLIFDLDAQMSLTQAIATNEDGKPFPVWDDWYETCKNNRKTIFAALEQFDTGTHHFNFPVGLDFVYQISRTYHFVPSVEELYWTDLDVFDREKIKFFVQRLLEKIQHSQRLPKYDVFLFDCPPSFSLLSYSVLSCCDLILIPINPDFFSTKGIGLLLSTLKLRIQPHNVPKIAVIMNKAKKPGGSSLKKWSTETLRYLDRARETVEEVANVENLQARLFDTVIPDRVGIKRSFSEGLEPALFEPFEQLWKEVKAFLKS